MPILSIPQIWVHSLVDCWVQIFLLTGYWVGWSSGTRQLIAISLSYFVLPVSCMSRVETNSSNLFPFSDAWIGSSPNRIIWLRMRQFEERLRIFWFLRDQVFWEWVVIGNLIVWQDVPKSYPGGSSECATEKEWSTRPSVELPVGEKSLGASSFCGALPPYTASHHLGRKEGNIFQTSSTSSAVGQPCKSLVDAISLNQACWISGNTICSGITTFPYVLVPKNKNTIRNGGRLDICNKILQLQFLRQKVTPKNA